jgi:hypothetical protein
VSSLEGDHKFSGVKTVFIFLFSLPFRRTVRRRILDCMRYDPMTRMTSMIVSTVENDRFVFARQQ